MPELLFRPADIGLAQGGLAELVAEAVAACDPALQPLLLANVVLTGGNARLPNLRARLLRELRPLAPAHCAVRVTVAADGAPELAGWRGAAAVCGAAPAVTRAQYDEEGADRCQARFADW